MITTISFWLKDECITTVYGLNDFIPLKNGDTFWLNVDEMYQPKKTLLRNDGWKEEFIDRIDDSYQEKRKKYGNEKYKVIKTYRSLTVDPNGKNDSDHHKLNVEYTVKKVKRIYWKFWQTYRFKEFIKRFKKDEAKILQA